MLDALPPARRRLVVASGALAVLVVVVVLLGASRGWRDRVHPVPQSEQGPVLLVPGYGGSTTELEALAASLRDVGREAVVVPPLDAGLGDLHDQARALADTAAQVLNASGAGSVDVVGYSAGGVVARLWIGQEGGGSVVRRAVTLASPHHGTDVAALGAALGPDACPEACQQLATDSDLMRELAAGDETPDGPLWVSIWSTDDQVVVPPESARLEGAVDVPVQSVCPAERVAHADVPGNATVIAMTLLELGTGPPQVPGPGVCATDP